MIHDVMADEIVESACIWEDESDAFGEEVVEWNITGDKVSEWIGEELDEGGGWVQVRDEVKIGGVAGDVALNLILEEVARWKCTGA